MRLIHLRRPPVLTLVPEPFVPTLVALDEVDACWAQLCAANARCFDGSLLQVLGTSRNGHGGVQIHVQECAYRFFAVQAHGLACGVRPIGVKGIVELDGKLLVGRRSTHVSAYPSMWEFVPGGALEPRADPAVQLRNEFEEETGIALQAGDTSVAVALLDDSIARTWDIIYRVKCASSPTLIPSFEHSELALLSVREIDGLSDRSPACEAMRSLLRSTL